MKAHSSVFDVFLDFKKEKWKFEWLPMDPNFLKNINPSYKDFLSEFNLDTGTLDQGCYILTKHFMIKLRNEKDSLNTGQVLPLFFPRFQYINEGSKMYTLTKIGVHSTITQKNYQFLH